MKYSVLKDKVVINTNTGEMLGYIKDIGLDMKNYTINNFIIEDKCGLLCNILPIFFKKKLYTIEQDAIVSIGNDVILVTLKSASKRKVSL